MKTLQRWTVTSFALVSIAGQSACSGGGGAASGKPPAPAPRAITIDAAPVPARYSAALPDSVSALKAWIRGEAKDPPITHAVDNLLNGNPQWFARLDTASRAIPESDWLAWGRVWKAAFQYETTGTSFCAPARAIMAAPPGAMRAALAGAFARHCATPSDRALMLRADTPDWAVLEYFDPWFREDRGVSLPAYDARLASVARNIILEPRPAAKPSPATHTDSRGGVAFEIDPFELSEGARSAAFTLAKQGNEQADEALLKIHAQIKDRKTADVVALAFMESKNQKGRALAVAACKRIPKDPMCQPAQTFDVTPIAESPPVARDAITKRIAQLRDMGFSKVEKIEPTRPDSDDATQILLLAGYGTGFDVETGMYPNHHDSLMRELAELVAPELKDAVFEERAPSIEDESEPYELTVYAGGKRFRTMAENLGDWYDVGAVLDLLNAVMSDRKAADKFVVLDTGDQTAIVLAAPAPALAKAVDAGLIEAGDPAQAEKLGKEFEDRVIESLHKEE